MVADPGGLVAHDRLQYSAAPKAGVMRVTLSCFGCSVAVIASVLGCAHVEVGAPGYHQSEWDRTSLDRRSRGEAFDPHDLYVACGSSVQTFPSARALVAWIYENATIREAAKQCGYSKYSDNSNARWVSLGDRLPDLLAERIGEIEDLAAPRSNPPSTASPAGTPPASDRQAFRDAFSPLLNLKCEALAKEVVASVGQRAEIGATGWGASALRLFTHRCKERLNWCARSKIAQDWSGDMELVTGPTERAMVSALDACQRDPELVANSKELADDITRGSEQAQAKQKADEAREHARRADAEKHAKRNAFAAEHSAECQSLCAKLADTPERRGYIVQCAGSRIPAPEIAGVCAAQFDSMCEQKCMNALIAQQPE
jgi:hypothetical protein